MSSFDGKTPGLMDIFLFNWLQNAIYWELPPFSRTNKKKIGMIVRNYLTMENKK